MREQNEQLGSVHSNHMPSVAGSRSRLDSHIKSSLAHLQGKQDKRYLFLKVHNSFADHRDQNCLRLIELLREKFESKAEIRYFKDTKELLADSYDDNQLHYIFVPEGSLAWAQTFAKQQRQESKNRKKIYVYGLLQKNVAVEKKKALLRKKIEEPHYVQYITKDDPDYPYQILGQIETHLQERLLQEGKHTRTWAVTNKFAGKSVKRRALHFFYEPLMEKELTGMYQAYRRKAKSSWIQIYKYESFEDVLRKIRERSQAFTREQETARQVTSRILMSTSEIEAPSMRSGFEGGGAGLNSSILSSSIRAINKLDQYDVNIIIAQAQNRQIQKFRALVRAQKNGNWLLWELASESADFFEQLKHFLNKEVKGNQQREAEEYERIVRSRSLIILALSSDSNTIDMFNSQQNVFHNMQLLLYSDAEEFSILLREGVQSSQDFVVAVVPGGFKSFATEYARVIAEFDAKYRNVDCVQNYKFISNANGRHVSNIVSSNLLGTQSNLTYCEDNNYLDALMKDRDKHFHPLQGLRGHNVYLLISESIQHQLDDLREYLAGSPRLHISTYIDRQFLTKQIQTITLKDSVLIITDNTTLRQAQAVARRFDQVSILNITDRDKVKEEVKVIASAKKEKIYELIKSIPETEEVLNSEIYEEENSDESYKRSNRVLPKRLTFRPGDTISIRLPANLGDEQSHKMEVRLQRHFNKEIKIEYYKEPRDVRIANKLEEPLAFIIWADSAEPALKDKRRAELEYFKELAKNEADELRLQFIIYSQQPRQYERLTVLPALERFKFVSSRWQRIEEYIIGSYRNFLSPQSGEDSIFSDEMIRVFFDDKDKASRQLVNAVSKRRDGDITNAANHVQFHLIDDLRATLEEQSPSHKYYIVLNEQTSDHSRPNIIKVLSDYPQVYARILLVYRDSAKKIQTQDSKVRRVFGSEGEAGEWLCKMRVILAAVEFVIPHVAIDRNCLEYYYFLEKYSRITARFTFAFYSARQDVRQQLLQRKGRPNDQVWIIVKDARSIGEYTRLLERSQNFKNVRFVAECGESLPMAARTQVVFRDKSRKEIEKFLLNIYRRDKSIFFPSSVRPASRIVLIIMHMANGSPIPINKQEIGSWEDILKAEILFAKDMAKLTETVKQRPNDALYVVYPSSNQKEVSNLCGAYRNLRRVALAPEFDPRKLGANFVQTTNKLYIGTYPAEVTDYLRKLRYNLRRSEEALQKRITHQIIELNLQKEYKVTEQQLNYLTNKNDSVIVTANGFEPAQLPALLTRADKFSYLQIFVGDEETTGKAVADFNKKRGKAVQFVDAKASPLIYMGQGQGGQRLLQTNEREQLITFLFNIPENRYLKAINNRGKFLLYCNPQENSIYPYVTDLKQICQRNPKIEVRHYANSSMLGSVLKQPGVILISGMSEKEYLQKVKPVSGVSYMVANEEYSSERNYANYGNKLFITRHAKEFQNFLNQVATNYDATLAPIPLLLDTPASLTNIANFNSKPLPNAFPHLKTHPPFTPKPPEQAEELSPVELRPAVIDSAPPSLLSIDFPLADVPSLPLGFEVLRKISDASVRGQNQILRANLDAPPAQGWFNIRSEPDSFADLPRSIALPKPAPPMRLKLAVIHPTSREFSAIGEMLKRNLQPQQFSVTILQFKSEHQLEEYSKNNGQRLNGYDKIVVFLSHPYRKYDSTLRLMKSKLAGRMEYFFFEDSFHLNAHPTLKAHLRPYRIKPYPLPYSATALPAHLTNSPRIVILVPHLLLPRYQGLKAPHISVVGYSGDGEIRGQLHRQGTFLIIVCDRSQYHQLKMYAKVSPRCRLVVDTPQDLPEDELYLYRIPNYALYYGSAAAEYLRGTLPARAGTGNEDLRFLFFGTSEEELAFMEEFDDYQRVHFADWRELYQLLLYELRGRSNWLIKPSPGRPELLPLHPRVYLQPKDYMRDFKNNFTERGYLNDQKQVRKSTLAIHEFADLPEVYYSDEKELTRLLEKQESPSVVLWDAANMRVGLMRGKLVRHKWVGLSDYSDRWIDPEGELPEVTDDRLVRKQDMFTNMFNTRVFDEFNDMQYYYLSNKAHVDHTRNIQFRTKEQLLQTFTESPHLLMVVFVQAKDIAHIPQALLASNSDPLGHAKLILLKTAFVDDYDTLYIKFNEIDAVIKHINAVESAGRIDFIVYNQAQGERTRQNLIQKRRIKNFENKPYTNSFDLDDIARNIKGRYKKVFVICLPDQLAEIETLFTSYAIQNKGIPNQGVEFISIDRLSSIRPNLSHLSNIRQAQNKPQGYPSDSQNPIPPSPTSEHTLRPDSRSRKDVPAIVYTDSANYGVKDRQGETERRGRYNIAEEYLQKQRNRQDYIEEEDFQLPNTQSNIKPPNKMDGILATHDYQLNIDEKLKRQFPPQKFKKARYFKDAGALPDAEGRPQIIISAQANPELAQLAEEADNFVVVVGAGGKGIRSDGNTLVVDDDEVPGLVRKLQGNEEDDLAMRNLDDFEKVRVVYDKDMDLESKKRLLAASEKNKKICPTIFRGVSKLKEYMQEPDSLLLLMMSYDPENLQATVAQQNKMIVKKRRIKMILPRKGDSEVDGLQTILQQEEADQDNEAIKKLTNEQVDLYLKIYQNSDGDRPPLTPQDDWQADRQVQADRQPYGQGADLDNITKLNVHSNIRPENLFREQQLDRIKQRLTGDLIVLVIDSVKREQVDEAVGKYNVLVQAYTNSMNLQNDIRDRKDNVTLAVIDRNMLDKIPSIKKKYPHAAFILEADTPHDDGIDQYRPYLAGQIRKMADLQKLIADLYQENERIRYNAESLRAASRFQMKKTSMVDVSNNQRFSVGLSNQKAKKVFLFYKQPENSHVKTRLSDTFNNINFIPYKTVADFKRLVGAYNNYSSILIANGADIPELEDFVSKKKEMIYVIRFNPPADLRDNPKVKKLFSTYKRDDLERFIFDEFQKYSLTMLDTLESRLKATKNVEGKRYIQKYEPNTFGTTPRFPGDFVPPKSKESTYSRKYMKSTSRSKLSSRLEALSPKSPRNLDYFNN